MRELSTQCGEACIFVLNEVWSHLIRFVLLHAHRHINFLDVSVLSDDVRFSNMGTEWGGYHLHLLFESPSLCYFDVSLTMLMGDAQFASVSAKKD